MNFPQENENGSINILDDLKEREMKDPKVQAMLKTSRHINLSLFIMGQDLYELPRRTFKTNGNINLIFKPNRFREFQNLYQEKASMDMTLDDFKNLTSFCWVKKYRPLTIDMTKDKKTCSYCLGLNGIFVPISSNF